MFKELGVPLKACQTTYWLENRMKSGKKIIGRQLYAQYYCVVFQVADNFA